MRIGMGYDVHRLVPDRKLIIGGIDIPYEKGLLGHSDADVLLHAIADALLGAAAMGDIGKHFPDTDERFAGADSLNLLAMVGAMLDAESYMIENIDATIIAQAPKMRPYIDRMRENIAGALGIDVSQVNVKATTEEGLGFTGSGEGIAAQAVCMLTNPREFATMDMAHASMADINGTFETVFTDGATDGEQSAASCAASACASCPMSKDCGKIN